MSRPFSLAVVIFIKILCCIWNVYDGVEWLFLNHCHPAKFCWIILSVRWSELDHATTCVLLLALQHLVIVGSVLTPVKGGYVLLFAFEYVYMWTEVFCVLEINVQYSEQLVEFDLKRGAWVAQLVKLPVHGFCSGHDLTVVRSSPEPWVSSPQGTVSLLRIFSPSAPTPSPIFKKRKVLFRNRQCIQQNVCF